MGFRHSPWERIILLEAVQPGHEVSLVLRVKQLIYLVIIHQNRLHVLNKAVLSLSLSLEIQMEIKGRGLRVVVA